VATSPLSEISSSHESIVRALRKLYLAGFGFNVGKLPDFSDIKQPAPAGYFLPAG